MQRKYLCNVIGDGGVDPLGTGSFRPSIGGLLDDFRLSWSALDLRTLEDQAAHTGHMLVIVDDIPTFEHEQIMALPNTDLFNDNMTQAAIIARIGTTDIEAEPFTPGQAENYLGRAHANRRARFINER